MNKKLFSRWLMALMFAMSLSLVFASCAKKSDDEDSSDDADKTADTNTTADTNKTDAGGSSAVVAGMRLTSSNFTNGGDLPRKFNLTGNASINCGDGSNDSPQLTWTDVPADTEAYALIMDDENAENPRDSAGNISSGGAVSGKFVHWFVLNIPKATTSLSENAGRSTATAGGVNALTSYSNVANTNIYLGPCPTDGKEHTYRIKVYALKKSIPASVTSTASSTLYTREQFENGKGFANDIAGVDDNILDSAEITGKVKLP